MNAEEIEKYIRENQLTSDECEGIYNALMEQNEVLYGQIFSGKDVRNAVAVYLANRCGIGYNWDDDFDETREKVVNYLQSVGYKKEDYEKVCKEAINVMKKNSVKYEKQEYELTSEQTYDYIFSVSCAALEIREWLKENGKTNLDCD